MYTNSQTIDKFSSTSTPKRRRLGTGRILRPRNNVESIGKDEFLANCSPINRKIPCSGKVASQRSESPHLPCNQVEYLCESKNSSASDIPCSPDILECSAIRDAENWESLIVSTNKTEKLNQGVVKMDAIDEFDEISADMFHSKLEQSNCGNQIKNTSKLESNYKEKVEQGFDMVNQSICQTTDTKKCDKSSLFETKDSFLLDIKESGIVTEERPTDTYVKPKGAEMEGFYGLPMATKGLFKTYRNIEKFYDWQEECLNLDAIKNRRNLIYALPTSGGKTLVAEVLMLREVLCRNRNALFILPFVAIVQEKIWALSPFAVQLGFLVEEYAAGKGHLPPKRRRTKHSIYVATIEKGLALIRSLIELNRLDEIGLIVVDELHLIGEKGRGGTLETLLTTVIFANKNIQVVGMSATIGNVGELARFLRADVFARHFRPVELTERVKVGAALYRIRWGDAGVVEYVPDEDTQLHLQYSESAKRLDPDGLAALVWRSASPCLVFCPTKRNCENVANLLCQLQPSELANERGAERAELERALRGEGGGAGGAGGEGAALWRGVRRGVAFHHAGLAPDERAHVEQAFRSGVLTVLCCTSTLAAGVNLPAARVLIRAPYVGREPITLAAYRQMAGRAGRAGVCETGESIVVCPPREWRALRGVLSRGVAPARSVLEAPARSVLEAPALLLSAVALGLATTREAAHRLMEATLLAVPHDDGSESVDIKAVCDSALLSLLRMGALQAHAHAHTDAHAHEHIVHNDTPLGVSPLAQAAIKGCMDLSTAKQLLQDLEVASRSLVLMGGLHLLYLVTPHDADVRIDYRHYYSLYCGLDEEGVQTAKILGITEMNAIRMVTGKPITNVPERVVRRFYLALMLHDLWKEMPLPDVANKYMLCSGTVWGVVSGACAFAGACARLCAARGALWGFAALFAELAPRLQHCAHPHIGALMELPNVKKTRALQLARGGFRRVEDLAKATADRLAAAVPHLTHSAARHLISAARMMLIEKVENLRAEAEDVMEELNG